jgi:hypothetical protein
MENPSPLAVFPGLVAIGQGSDCSLLARGQKLALSCRGINAFNGVADLRTLTFFLFSAAEGRRDKADNVRRRAGWLGNGFGAA